MKYLLYSLFTLFVLAHGGNYPGTSNITITSPDQSSSLSPKDSLDIKWKLTPNTTVTTFSIGLFNLDDPSLVGNGTIVDGINVNTLSYHWNLTNMTVKNGDEFVLRFFQKGNDSNVYAESQPFKIADGTSAKNGGTALTVSFGLLTAMLFTFLI